MTSLLPDEYQKGQQGEWEYTGKFSIVLKNYLDPTILAIIITFLKYYGFNISENIATCDNNTVSSTEQGPYRRGIVIQAERTEEFIHYCNIERIFDGEGRILWPICSFGEK